MLDCISVANMRDSDAYTIANLVPSLELMHRAARGVFRAHHWQGRTAILTGSGNNCCLSVHNKGLLILRPDP